MLREGEREKIETGLSPVTLQHDQLQNPKNVRKLDGKGNITSLESKQL